MSKSGSQTIHEFICENYILWGSFNYLELHEAVTTYHPEITKGMIGGFIARAQRMGMIVCINNKKPYRYEIRNLDPWNFHAPGIGSKPGRHIHHEPKEEQLGLSLGSNETNDDHNIDSRVYDTIESNIFKDIPNRKFNLNECMGQPVITPLSEQLIEIALKVEQLERKTLKDYSTDELLNEIKKRIK